MDGGFHHSGHDHGQCVADALVRAEQRCQDRCARLTALRRRVLELVWANHRPVGAYDLLDQLAQERSGVAPPTVYRALDFLMDHNLVHRIQSLNAYVGCADPDHVHEGLFLVCTGCGMAAELDDAGVEHALIDAAGRNGFSVTRRTVEIEGLCPGCGESDDNPLGGDHG